MASNYKVLGQSAPVADTDTTVYTVPASSSAVISTITLCNRSTGSSASSFRIAVVPNGETLGPQHYLMYGELLDVKESLAKTMGLTLATGDSIVVRSDSADLSFCVFGNEITA